MRDPAYFLIMGRSIESALKLWKKVLGPDCAVNDAESLRAYSNDTTVNPPKASAVLKPKDIQSVQAIVKIANHHRVPIYPISRGKNWGYGAACPVNDGDVVVDLSDLNRIVDVNTELAYCVIEPGVTQQQLYDHLTNNKIPLWMDVTGGPPDSSLIGNALERGFGHTPYADHFRSICGLEVVLPSGELIKTGFGHFQNAQTAHLYPYGIGPYLDGLFTQSNFGIVVRMGVWLMPKPETMTAFFGKIEDDAALLHVVEKLRVMKLNRDLPGCLHIANAQRVLSMGDSAPKDVKAWNFSGAFYGDSADVKLKTRKLLNRLRDVAELKFVDEQKLRIAKKFPNALKTLTGVDLPRMLPALSSFFGLLKGVPNGHALKGAYFRNPTPVPRKNIDAVRDNCGLYWISPVIPAHPSALTRFLALVRPIYKMFDFDFHATLNLGEGRTICAILSISFNKFDHAEAVRASRCYEKLSRELIGAGYVPYRTGVQSMRSVVKRNDSFWKFVNTLKEGIDPNQILSPGRYNIG